MLERGEALPVDKSVVMWHVVLMCNHAAEPIGVAITQNPLSFDKAETMAQVVMYKTRSLGCAQQVARFVRRTEIPDSTRQTRVDRFNRPIEAMIGYVCMNGMQYPPTRGKTPGYETMLLCSTLKISEMLERVRGGANAARGSYVVYEVRSKNWPPLRAVTNKFHSVERTYREAPPDTLVEPDLVAKGTYQTAEAAEEHCRGFDRPGHRLWTRRPPIEYLKSVVREEGDDIVFVRTGDSAIRNYEVPTVVIGPHSYTVPHIRHALRMGFWYDGYIRQASGPTEMMEP